MPEKESCELIVKAKSLAEKRGLEPEQVMCPVEAICHGEVCYLLTAMRREAKSERKREAHQRENPQA